MPYDTYFFSIYRDEEQEYRWRLYAPNERAIAESGEGFTRRHDCEVNIALVRRVIASAPVRVAEPVHR